jgi:predicted nucleotide-binding protein
VLEALLEEVSDPSSLYRAGEQAEASWKSRVLTVLTEALGPKAELAEKFRSNPYGLFAFSDSTPESAWARAHKEGVERAKGYVEAAVFQLRLREEARVRVKEQPSASSRSGRPESLGEPDRRAVFVVHGRNALARDATFEFLRAIGLAPIEWAQAIEATGRPSPYVGEVLAAAFGKAQAVLVLLTPDDEGQLRAPYRTAGDAAHETGLTPQARANVVFEAGMAMAWDENRTVLVELGRCRPFSDIGGRHVLRLDGSSERRQELASRLRSAGLLVDTSGTDWHRAGDFDRAVEA